MAELTEAERYLLAQVRQGDPAAWSQLVDRYQGRLLAFARGRVRQGRADVDAEDFVQETFAAFLQAAASFRSDCSVESYLFTILRRKLIDALRGRGQGVAACSIQDVLGGKSDDAGERGGFDEAFAGREPTASWYARRDEQADRLSRALAAGIESLAARLKASENLRDLRLIELLFYANVRNQEAARLCGIDEKQVALIKHRCLKEVRGHAIASLGADPPDEAAWAATEQSAGSLLTEVWERTRPTCPKRSTVGRYLLGTLEPAWQAYVAFHLDELGCRFCQANLADLRREDVREPAALRERIFQSTVGFLGRAPR